VVLVACLCVIRGLSGKLASMAAAVVDLDGAGVGSDLVFCGNRGRNICCGAFAGDRGSVGSLWVVTKVIAEVAMVVVLMGSQGAINIVTGTKASALGFIAKLDDIALLEVAS
jgi:type IV secretory pathway TrbD component